MRIALGIALCGCVGCFTPTFDDVQCGPLGECPPGHTCNNATGLCESSTGTPTIDAAIDAARVDASPVDAAVDAAIDATVQCDPLNQETCPEGMMCTFVATEINSIDQLYEGETLCVPEGSGAGDSVCEWIFSEGVFVSTCGPGLICPNDQDGARCTPICPIGGDTCSAPSSCEQHAGGIFSDRTGVGFCVGP